MRLTHIIAQLGIGGAETSLCQLVEATAGNGVSHTVISMLPDGELQPRLEKAGATVHALNGQRGINGARLLPQILATLRRSKPDLVQGWMYHANIAASVAGPLCVPGARVIWGIRQGLDEVSYDRRTTRVLIKSGRVLSYHPRAIVYNSQLAALDHETIGYAANRRIVIPNGIDCERFKPRPGQRVRLLAELNLPSDAILIGRAARYAPMKDFPALFAAFKTIAAAQPKAHLVLAGPGLDDGNAHLMALCRTTGAAGRIHCLGPRLDMEHLYPALDVLTMSSKSNEGFPNTVAEALACGTLVCATRIGEERLIAGCHAVVAPGSPEELACAVLRLLGLPAGVRRDLGLQGRNFIVETFNTTAMGDNFLALYREILPSARAGTAPSL